MMLEFGGSGPEILLLHGLMGRASTWWRTAQWLTRFGHVVGLDALAHGRNPKRGAGRTEDFVADIAAVLTARQLAPAVVIGHSMGGLHALGLAAAHPDLVRALVIEDMAVDQRGRTVEAWRPHFDSWPAAFQSLAQVRDFFGDAGDYFIECVEERSDGYHLIADMAALYEIAEEWGQRDYWSFVDRVRCPLLAIEAARGIVPDGQMAEVARRAHDGRHLLVAGAAHIVHDDAPDAYRAAVEAFLTEVLPREHLPVR
ncbi:MAG: alpha/beta fold hydrolase [Sciscionella sp.]